MTLFINIFTNKKTAELSVFPILTGDITSSNSLDSFRNSDFPSFTAALFFLLLCIQIAGFKSLFCPIINIMIMVKAFINRLFGGIAKVRRVLLISKLHFKYHIEKNINPLKQLISKGFLMLSKQLILKDYRVLPLNILISKGFLTLSKQLILKDCMSLPLNVLILYTFTSIDKKYLLKKNPNANQSFGFFILQNR